MGGVRTVPFVIVKDDNSDHYWPENPQRRYSKLPAWMFWGTLTKGRKKPLRVLSKE